MKKLFLFIFLGFTGLIMTSCLNNDSTPVSAVAAGVAIYDMGKIQPDLDFDPMTVALKLNTLIQTAIDEETTIDKVTIVTEPADEDKDDSEDETALVVELLFGKDNTVTQSGTKYTVEYTSSDLIDKEMLVRTGTITIETNGVTLGELSLSDLVWEISGNYDLQFYGSSNKFTNRFDYYTVSGIDPRTWEVEAVSKSIVNDNDNYPAYVVVSYEVNGPGSFHYDDVQKSYVYVTGSSTGQMTGYDNLKLVYRADEIKYKPSCSTYTIFGGKEYFEIERKAFAGYEDIYPENYVTYRWYDAGSCTSSAEITYNGYTVSY